MIQLDNKAIVFLKFLGIHKLWRPVLKLRNKLRDSIGFIKIMGFSGYIQFTKAYKNANDGAIIGFQIKGYTNKLYMRTGTSDIEVFKQVFINKEFQDSHTKKIDPLFIVDCGAYIGFSTVFFAIQYPNAQIIAVEPELGNFEMLEKNTKEVSNISIIRKGIRWKNDYLAIENHGRDWSFRLSEEGKSNQHIETITINEIIEQSGKDSIDILKIDIEGAEEGIFINDSDRWLKKTKCIIMELHERFLPGSTKKIDSIAGKYFSHRKYIGENVVYTTNQYL